ncbi:MAG: hypothetical protein ACJAUH_002123 [Saprospiraceae bacterium]
MKNVEFAFVSHDKDSAVCHAGFYKKTLLKYIEASLLIINAFEDQELIISII